MKLLHALKKLVIRMTHFLRSSITENIQKTTSKKISAGRPSLGCTAMQTIH